MSEESVKEEVSAPRLTAAQYWEWRTTIAEMIIEKNKLAEKAIHHKLLSKEAELLSVRTQLFLRGEVETQKSKVKSAEEEYNRFKKVLEESLGVSLSEKMIDEFTYEVKDLPSDPKQP